MAVIKSKSGMSVAEGTFHAFRIACTCGFLHPVYRMHKHQAGCTTKTYVGE